MVEPLTDRDRNEPRRRFAGRRAGPSRRSVPVAWRGAALLLGGWPLGGWFWLLFFVGASALPAMRAGAATNYVEIFAERFDDDPAPRFKVTRLPAPAGVTAETPPRYDATRKAWALEGWSQAVRPVKASPCVALDLDLRFDARGARGQAAGEDSVGTAFELILLNRTVAGMEIRRPIAESGTAVVRLVSRVEGDAAGQVLREEALLGGPADGPWTLEYRHGLLVVRQGATRLAVADLGVLGGQVVGVGWRQLGGRVTCRRMGLRGEPAQEWTEAQSTALRQAARLTDDAQRLTREGKSDDALPKLREASTLVVGVLGEEHYDSGTAFAAFAAALDAVGNGTLAERYWTRALSAHERALGANHPRTTLTRFNYGKHLFDLGQAPAAKKEWTQCRDDWREWFGADYPLAKSLEGILGRL